MFEVKAGTTILVFAPFWKVNGPVQVAEGDTLYIDNGAWKGYVTKETKLYDKHQVWDYIAVHNEREDVPEWARINILNSRGLEVIIWDYNAKGEKVYARVKAQDITFLD